MRRPATVDAVIRAKVLAGLTAGVAAIVLSVGFASLATALSGAPDGFAHFGPAQLSKFGILQITGILHGLAFDLLFLNPVTRTSHLAGRSWTSSQCSAELCAGSSRIAWSAACGSGQVRSGQRTVHQRTWRASSKASHRG